MSPRQQPPLPPHGPFTCEEARTIAALYPPATGAPCNEPGAVTPIPPAVGDSIPYEADVLEFATFGKWSKNCLTHRADPALEQLYVQAFAVWSAVANIRDCGPVASGEDITVRVNTALPGNTAGQCAWFISGGIISHGTLDIKNPAPKVIAHELGHCVGLGHSSIPQALMAAFCANPCTVAVLHADDIAAIQSLYGPSPGGTPTPGSTVTQSSTATPSVCSGIGCVTRTPSPSATPTRPPLQRRALVPGLARD